MMWRRFANKGEATEIATMTKVKMMGAIMFALITTVLPVMARPSAHDISIPSSAANR